MSKFFMENKQEVIKQFQTHEKDCGSTEVQVAIITERVKSLTEHLKRNSKDFAARRGLLLLVGQRSSLLKYLKSKNMEKYRTLIERLGIRK